MLIAPKTEFFERIRNVPELRSTRAILTAVQALEYITMDARVVGAHARALALTLSY